MDGIRRVVWLVVFSLAASTATPGCQQAAVFPAPESRVREAAKRLWRPGWSPSTATLLDRLGLEELARVHPRETFSFLEQSTDDLIAEPERLLALAELADEISATEPRGAALIWSRDAAVYAAFYLAQPSSDGSLTPGIAWDVHNHAVRRCLQLVRSGVAPGQSDWPGHFAAAGILITSTVPEWTSLGFDALQTIDESAATRRAPNSQRAGLGVPLIAHRWLTEAELINWKPFGPREAIFAATAVIQPSGSLLSWRSHPVELVLHEPLHEETVSLGGAFIPLAASLLPPLARRLGQKPMRNYEYRGVFDPDSYAAHAGVYVLDPYQPGKIPVVLVQGLWSSPSAWVSMLNALRTDPVLRQPINSGSSFIPRAIRFRWRRSHCAGRCARLSGGLTPTEWTLRRVRW